MPPPEKTTCRKCGREIVFARREGGEKDGHWLALDPDPVEGGRWYVYRPASRPRGPLQCRFMPGTAAWPTGSLPRNPHWMTCPAAEEFRRKRSEGTRSPKTPEEERRRIEEFVVQGRRREAEGLAPDTSTPKARRKR